ncbi:MAG: hypothetical protein AAFY41_03855 [Bacteroidota bacterium]
MKPNEWDKFQENINSKLEPGIYFKIDLENTVKVDLAFFNQLLMLYTKLKRSGANINYRNFGEYIRKYVDKTNFQHVFLS